MNHSTTQLLSRERERELLALAKSGDEKAMEELVASNMGLVYEVALKYKGFGDFDDLVGEGVLGLMIAIEKFDLNRSVKLSTYATPWIKLKVSQAARNSLGVVKVPEPALKRMRETGEQLVFLSLEGKNSEEDQALEEKLGLEDARISLTQKRILLTQLLSRLPSREREVLILCFGLTGEEWTRRQIAEMYLVSTEKLKKIVDEALELLGRIARDGKGV